MGALLLGLALLGYALLSACTALLVGAVIARRGGGRDLLAEELPSAPAGDAPRCAPRIPRSRARAEVLDEAPRLVVGPAPQKGSPA